METTNKVVEVINALCEKFGIVFEWTNKNILPYVEDLIGRFIKFEIATSIFLDVFYSYVDTDCILCRKILSQEGY